jgi:hypothetical protein
MIPDLDIKSQRGLVGKTLRLISFGTQLLLQEMFFVHIMGYIEHKENY